MHRVNWYDEFEATIERVWESGRTPLIMTSSEYPLKLSQILEQLPDADTQNLRSLWHHVKVSRDSGANQKAESDIKHMARENYEQALNNQTPW